MSRWLVTGAAGLLGADVVSELVRAGHEVLALTRHDLDITDAGAVTSAVTDHRPDVVVNAAAWTAVDEAEQQEPSARLVNEGGASNLAAACATAAVPVMLQVSTDYVFDGRSSRPYAEDAVARPRTAYGRTKLGGERAVLSTLPLAGYVVRTAWLHGAHGRNFVLTMAGLRGGQATVDVVADQHGQPTSSQDLGVRLRQLGEAALDGRAPPGVYHGTSSGATTWFGLARAVFELLDADPDRVRAVTSAQFPRPAPRPAWSVLGHARWRQAGLPPMPPWRDGVERTLAASGLLPPGPSAG